MVQCMCYNICEDFLWCLSLFALYSSNLPVRDIIIHKNQLLQSLGDEQWPKSFLSADVRRWGSDGKPCVSFPFSNNQNWIRLITTN